MTLVEVMMAAAVFGLALLGSFTTAVFMFRTSVRNVADGVALHAAEGMMEQIRVMPYESTLLRLAGNPAGGNLVFWHYDPMTRAKVSQSVPVNGETTLSGVCLSASLDKSFAVISQSPMTMSVRIVLTPVRADFASGVTVELFYRYGAGPGGGESRRVLRTFIPSSIS